MVAPVRRYFFFLSGRRCCVWWLMTGSVGSSRFSLCHVQNNIMGVLSPVTKTLSMSMLRWSSVLMENSWNQVQQVLVDIILYDTVVHFHYTLWWSKDWDMPRYILWSFWQLYCPCFASETHVSFYSAMLDHYSHNWAFLVWEPQG